MFCVQLFVNLKCSVFVARLVRRANHRVQANPPTAFDRAIMMFVQADDRPDDDQFAQITTKTRPEVVPFAAARWNIRTSDIY